MILCVHCKNKIVKMANLLVARNSGNCNLIGHIGCNLHDQLVMTAW